jgi:hypothetical protein
MVKRRKNPLEAPASVPIEIKRSRWRAKANFWLAAAQLQAERCRSKDATAQSQIADLNFFIVACQRLRGVANSMKKFPKVAEALAAFDERWSKLKALRDVQEHSYSHHDPDHGFFGVTYFGEFVANLLPGGKVEYLVDTRWDMLDHLAELHRVIVAVIEEDERKSESSN